jgi:hypothetical protein
MRATPKPRRYRSLIDVREEAARCRDCPLWKNATQTVFGDGSESASIMFIGEQPGDQEDPRANRSSARPAACSIGRWWTLQSTARPPTSPMR